MRTTSIMSHPPSSLFNSASALFLVLICCCSFGAHHNALQVVEAFSSPSTTSQWPYPSTRLFAYQGKTKKRAPVEEDAPKQPRSTAPTFIKDTLSRLTITNDNNNNNKEQDALHISHQKDRRMSLLPRDLIAWMPQQEDSSKAAVANTAGSWKETLKESSSSSFAEASSSSSSSSSWDPKTVLLSAAVALVLTSGWAVSHTLGWTSADVVAAAERLLAHPQESMQAVIASVQDMGSMGPVYFGILYLIAELLAVPATPLTLSAGYLFGVQTGTAVVLLAATIAASVAFVVGKTFLRSWVEDLLKEHPKFAKLDQAIGQEGFKLLLLVRLSPIFPFALSNYLYGASSINFVSYFWGTLLGFAPGTLAYVYTGMVGQALTLGESSQPWYVYAGGLGVLVVVLKLVTDVATEIVEAIDEGGEKQKKRED
jgi:uncharacterized membrane protein YdjX (TVP38/TMEM64 family)